MRPGDELLNGFRFIGRPSSAAVYKMLTTRCLRARDNAPTLLPKKPSRQPSRMIECIEALRTSKRSPSRLRAPRVAIPSAVTIRRGAPWPLAHSRPASLLQSHSCPAWSDGEVRSDRDHFRLAGARYSSLLISSHLISSHLISSQLRGSTSHPRE